MPLDFQKNFDAIKKFEFKTILNSSHQRFLLLKSKLYIY